MKHFLTGILLSLCMTQFSFANHQLTSLDNATINNTQHFPQAITVGQIKTSAIQTKVYNVLAPIYKDLGIELKLMSLPSKRALSFSNQGQLDGELLRVEGIEEIYENLVPVSIPLYQVDAYAYTIEGETNFEQAADVLRFNVGIHRGVHWEESFVSQFPRYVSRVGSTKQKFKLLTLGRVDYVLSSEQRAKKVIAKHFPGAKIKRVSPMLKTINLIHYLHKKHAHIIPALEAEIKKRQLVLPLSTVNH